MTLFFIAHTSACKPPADQSRDVNDEGWSVWLNTKTNFTQQASIEGKVTAGTVFKRTFLSTYQVSGTIVNTLCVLFHLVLTILWSGDCHPHLEKKKEANRYSRLFMVTLPASAEGGVQTQTLTTDCILKLHAVLRSLATAGSKDLNKPKSA